MWRPCSLSIFVPGALHAALFLGGIGSIRFLICYAAGMYIAFSEDSLQRFALMLIHFYQAYHIVSRRGEMWPWLAGMTVAVGLTFVAVWMIGSEDRAIRPEANAWLDRSKMASPPLITSRIRSMNPVLGRV